ncbi:hypothetical protein ACWDA3_27625 [Nonomuraea rubra]
MNVPTDERGAGRRLAARRRWRVRLGVIASIAVLLPTLVAPGAAHAVAEVPCSSTGITDWKLRARAFNLSVWDGYRFTLLSSTPQFFVSDARQLVNDTDLPVNYTVSSSVSNTYTVEATAGVSVDVGDFLTTTVSTKIVMSRTTAIGASLTVTVPPRTRLIAEYGVEGYDVSYNVDMWLAFVSGKNPPPFPATQQCQVLGTFPQQTIAPTYVEGWRVRTA